jgi:hypothetical protein
MTRAPAPESRVASSSRGSDELAVARISHPRLTARLSPGTSRRTETWLPMPRSGASAAQSPSWSRGGRDRRLRLRTRFRVSADTGSEAFSRRNCCFPCKGAAEEPGNIRGPSLTAGCIPPRRVQRCGEPPTEAWTPASGAADLGARMSRAGLRPAPGGQLRPPAVEASCRCARPAASRSTRLPVLVQCGRGAGRRHSLGRGSYGCWRIRPCS